MSVIFLVICLCLQFTYCHILYCNVLVVMAEKRRVCERKRKHATAAEVPTLLQAASDICKIFNIEPNGLRSDNGLCID